MHRNLVKLEGMQCTVHAVRDKQMYKVTSGFVDDDVFLHCVSKNDSDVLRYNFNAHQPILIIFGTDIAE